jgi:mono/diheme cytochrome c family protein/uncharacterized membrane protein
MINRLAKILYNTSILINCLLIFLLVFDQRISVPAWLQVGGRMHPLLLHFPIVLFILFIVLQFYKSSSTSVPNYNGPKAAGLLLLTVFTASLTALMGLLLSKESGYDTEGIQLHKYAGAGLSVLALVWYSRLNYIQSSRAFTTIFSIVAAILIATTGHQGGNITHGEDYLLAPVAPDAKKTLVSLEDALIYRDMVQPIFEEKCIGCHSQKKAKGSLIMETEAGLLKGGKTGVLWAKDNPELSLLLERIHLPEDNKKHMPLKGKPQLDDNEMEIINHWIESGASFSKKVTDLSPADTLYLIANQLFGQNSEDSYNFAAANESAVEKLSNGNRLVHELSVGSPALSAVFYNKQNYTSAALKELLPLKEQLVDLNMANMPVKDADAALIKNFVNLRHLNLNNTDITGAALKELAALPYIKNISITGTGITNKDLSVLSNTRSLKKIFAWNTAIKELEATAWNNAKHSSKIIMGFNADTMLLKLTPPIIANEFFVLKSSLPLKLKHYINGVNIHYTTDGSEPDSLQSPLYDGKTTVSKNTVVKARAFKPGWISSDVVEASFYLSTFTPDSAVFLQPVDNSYKGNGVATLIDGIKSGLNYRNGEYVGFRNNPMNTLFFFNQPTKLESVTVSTMVDIDAYLMPPLSVAVWGGTDVDHLKLLGRITPTQPSKTKASYTRAQEIKFGSAELKVIKILVEPVPKLPVWHRGKNDKGWVFMDEVFFN